MEQAVDTNAATPPVKAELTPSSIGAAIACGVGGIVSVSVIVNPTLSFFLVKLTHAFGWSRTQFSLEATVFGLTGAVLFPVGGLMIDRWGVRYVALGGVTLIGLALVALAFQNGSIEVFYAIFFVIGIGSAISGVVPMTKTVSGWFHRLRGTVLALTAMAGATTAALLPQMLRVVDQHFGWRGAYLSLAAVVLVLGLPILILLLREAPDATNRGKVAAVTADQEVFGLSSLEASRTLPFFLCLILFSVIVGSSAAVGGHAVAILTDRGVPMSSAINVLSAISIGAIAGRLLEGVLLDRFDTPKVAAPLAAMSLLGVILLDFGRGQLTYVAAGTLFGAGVAGDACTIPYFISRFFGLRAFALIYGWLAVAISLAVALGPVAMAMVFDRTGSYQWGLRSLEVLLAIAVLCPLLMPRYRFPLRGPMLTTGNDLIAQT